MKLRPYQEQAIEQVLEEFKKHDKVMLVMPTGSGKTFTASEICKKFNKVLWLAHQRELIVQAQKSTWRAGARNVDFTSPFVVGIPRDEFDLVVVDEAHHEAADSFRNKLSKIRFKKCLGLTATPFRMDNIPLWFEKQIVGTTLQELVDQGHLLKPRLMSMRAKTKEPLENVCEWIKENRKSLGKIILFVQDLEKAKIASKMLVGMKRFVVHGNSPRSVQLDSFENGDTEVLISCKVLTEGVDLPCTKSVIICRNTMSESLMLQMLGRALRPYKNMTMCNIIEVVPFDGRRQSIPIHELIKSDKVYSITKSRSGWVTKSISYTPRTFTKSLNITGRDQ